MKQNKRLLALAMVLIFVFTALTGCGSASKEAEEQERESITATQGGSITWPEDMDTTVRFGTEIDESTGTLYAVFNNTQNRYTGYFTTAGDSITLTSYATTESTGITSYLITLWKEGYGGREYVNGKTIEFPTGGECYTATFSGLEPGVRYKVGISYLSGTYYISGGLTISGLTGAEALAEDAENA